MRIPHRFFAVLTTASLFATACQDVATVPATIEGDSTVPTLSQSASGTLNPPYSCFVGTATLSGPNAFTYGLLTLNFPKGVRAQDGSVLVYRYRLLTGEGKSRYRADCIIPRTRAAVEITHQRFRVTAAARITYEKKNAAPAEIATMDEACGTEANPCQIDGIIVVVKEPVTGDPPPPDDGGGVTPPGTEPSGGGGETTTGTDGSVPEQPPQSDSTSESVICPDPVKGGIWFTWKGHQFVVWGELKRQKILRSWPWGEAEYALPAGPHESSDGNAVIWNGVVKGICVGYNTSSGQLNGIISYVWLRGEAEER